MAELSDFGYRPGASILHRLDMRFKLAALTVVTAAGVGAGPAGLGLLAAVLLALAWRLGLVQRHLLQGLRPLLVFLLLVCAVRAAATPGALLATVGPVTFTREGLREGLLVAGRIVLAVGWGLLFVRSSRPEDVKTAVAWLLRPLPFVRGQAAATMVGLIVRFIPVLFQQIHVSRTAWQARGGALRRSPLRRLRYQALPAVRRTVLGADQLAWAMQARCYQERPAAFDGKPAPRDALTLACALALGALALMV
jgi:energy-coupling factor transporter transmembrane protein EcfT